FGAWVQHGSLQQGARISAVQGLESAIGRRLDIVNTYRRFDEPFPTQSDRAFAAGGRTLMLSWVVDDTRQVASGAVDAQLRDWADRMRDFDHPMLVRLRWEMDRPNLRASMHSGADYVAAWTHVREVFAARGVRDVSWVWCPTADGFAGGYAQGFYPGDDQVDWVCVDAYAGSRLTPMADLLAPFLAWAGTHGKPIMIGEYGVGVGWGGSARAAWLAATAQTFRGYPLIKAVCYFDSDPDGNPPTKQYHLEGDPPALAAFTAMARDPWFRTRS
ncbi:MAG TPA: glycosyl hydrolase, partial [Rugosimonospora sp.]|nr:glycosyl hydrolase [Rugosimonospora sp.]